MILFQHKELVIRLLKAEDAALLVKWLSNPVLLAYYEGRDRPHDMAMVQEHFYNRASIVTACLIQFNKTPIGYLQFYELDAEDKLTYGYNDSSEIAYGMDQFIGEPEYWNRGIGSRLIQSMTAYLTRQHGASKIMMDPQTWNERAIHVYEKCGFVKTKLLKQHELHEGECRDCWLMVYSHEKENE